MGYARWPQDRDVLSANPCLGREAQEGFAPEGRRFFGYFLVATSKVTRPWCGNRNVIYVGAADSITSSLGRQPKNKPKLTTPPKYGTL